MRKPLPDTKNKIWPVRLSDKELAEILIKANKYTKGRVAAYIRWAALEFNPKKAA